MAPVFGYWKIRAFGQPIRLMLAYTKTKYEEHSYNYGPAPDFYDKSDWFKVKYSLGLDFPNLPYYIDGNVKLTQSLAIMRYLARKHDLEADTEEGRIRSDMVEQQAIDLRVALAYICYSPNYENLKDKYLEGLPTQIKAFSDFLGKRQWFTGDKLTYVDFLLYEVLDHQSLFAPGCLDDYPNLKEFLKRFENLPTIQEYMKSEDFIKWPLNGDPALFGSRKSKP